MAARCMRQGRPVASSIHWRLSGSPSHGTFLALGMWRQGCAASGQVHSCNVLLLIIDRSLMHFAFVCVLDADGGKTDDRLAISARAAFAFSDAAQRVRQLGVCHG